MHVDVGVMRGTGSEGTISGVSAMTIPSLCMILIRGGMTGSVVYTYLRNTINIKFHPFYEAKSLKNTRHDSYFVAISQGM